MTVRSDVSKSRIRVEVRGTYLTFISENFNPMGGGIWGSFFGWFAAGFGIASAKTESTQRIYAFRVTSMVFVSKIYLNK